VKLWTLLLAILPMVCGSVPAMAASNPQLAPVLGPQASVAPAVAASPPAVPQLASTPAGPHGLDKADVDAWLDGYMPYALHTGDIPGAEVVVVKDGKILTARGFGYADVDKRTPVDPERTLFRPGSVSKLFTWTAVMQLVEQHKLDLDADVNTYLDFKIPPLGGRPVTMRQLMTHTGGFEETGKGIVFFDRKYAVPLNQYLTRWIPTRIFAPGSTPAYSNWATALAAYVVQRVSGEAFEDYLDHHVFAPLAMHNATFHQPLPAGLAAQMAVGYPKPGQPSPGFEFIGPGPAGAASVSGTDMGRFMIAHLQGGELDGQRILQPATAAMMHDSPLDRVDPMSLIPPLSRMELGFFETNLNGREIIGHLGDTEAFHTSLHLFMKDGVGIYMSFNSPGKAGAVGVLRSALFQDFADRYFPNVAPADGRVEPKLATQHAQMMAGTWWASRRWEDGMLSILSMVGQTTVAVGAKGELVIPSILGPNGRPREWVEIAPFLWRDRAGHDRLAAKLVDGRVVRWSFDFASPFEMFDRVPAAKSASWLLPALYASLAVIILTALYWPIAALTRRHYRTPRALAAQPARVRRATLLMAVLTTALLIAWGAVLATMLSSPDSLAGGLDPVLLLLQGLSIVILVGFALISGWNLWTAFTTGRHWFRKLSSVLLFLASALILYVAITFNLMSLSVHY